MRERLQILLDRKFITQDGLKEIEENEFCLMSDGTESDIEGYEKVRLDIVQQGYLPTDEDVCTDTYYVYVK